MTTTRDRTHRSGLRVRLFAVGVIGAALSLAGAGQALAQPVGSVAHPSPAAAACQSFWPTPYPVCGEILDLYKSLGGPSGTLSYPSSAEAPAGDGIGARQTFFGGTVYYSPATGAYIE